MKFLRSCIFSIGFYISMIVCFPTAIIAFFLKNPKKFYCWTLWARFCIWWLGVCCNLKMRVRGLENIDKNGRYIYMANHQSEWETLSMQMVLPPFVFVLKKELMSLPIFGWALHLIGVIGIDRSKGREALRQISVESELAFQNGSSVLIFPEGTRQPYGTLGRFLPGGAYVAQKTGKPVIPIAHNAGRFWLKGKFIKEPGIIDVFIGTPIKTDGKTTRVIQQEVEAAITKMIAEIDNGQV